MPMWKYFYCFFTWHNLASHGRLKDNALDIFLVFLPRPGGNLGSYFLSLFIKSIIFSTGLYKDRNRTNIEFIVFWPFEN